MSEKRTIHLTKEEYEALMLAKYHEGYNHGYHDAEVTSQRIHERAEKARREEK